MSDNRIKYLYLTIIFQLVIFSVFGQKTKVTQDFRLVTELETVKSFFNKLEFGIGTKCWLEKDASQIGEIDIDADINYKPFSFLSVGLGYRWSNSRNKFDDFIKKHRFSGDIGLTAKIERFKIDYRICVQNIDDNIFQEDVNNPALNVLRNRGQLKYNFRNSKLTPFLSVEHYGRLERNVAYGIKVKSEIGTTYNIKKDHQLKAYYRFDRELINENPYSLYSLGLGYLYEF
jgi:hypothetical protein